MKGLMKKVTIGVGAVFGALLLTLVGILVWSEYVHARPGGIFQMDGVAFTQDYQRDNDAELRERVVDVLMEMDSLPVGIDRAMVDRFVRHPITKFEWDVSWHERNGEMDSWDYPVGIVQLNARIYGSMCEGVEAQCDWFVVGYVPFTVYVSRYEPRLLGINPQPDMAFVLFDENTGLVGYYCPDYKAMSDTC